MLQDLLPHRHRIVERRSALIPDIRWDGKRLKASYCKKRRRLRERMPPSDAATTPPRVSKPLATSGNPEKTLLPTEEHNVGIGMPSKYGTALRRLPFHAISGPEFFDQRSRAAPRQEPVFGRHGAHLEGTAFSREVVTGRNNGFPTERLAADD